LAYGRTIHRYTRATEPATDAKKKAIEILPKAGGRQAKPTRAAKVNRLTQAVFDSLPAAVKADRGARSADINAHSSSANRDPRSSQITMIWEVSKTDGTPPG
jgi:hypothetical protein